MLKANFAKLAHIGKKMKILLNMEIGKNRTKPNAKLIMRDLQGKWR